MSFLFNCIAMNMNSFHPICIEICGLPGAGKTSLCEAIELVLSDSLFNPLLIPAAAELSPEIHKLNPEFNLWTLGVTLTRLMAAVEPPSQRVIIVDKGLRDAQIWLQWHEQEGRLARETSSSLRGALESLTHRYTTHCVILTAEIETCIARGILRKKRASKSPTIFNSGVLERLDLALRSCLPIWKAVNSPPQMELDSTSASSEDMARAIVHQLLK